MTFHYCSKLVCKGSTQIEDEEAGKKRIIDNVPMKFPPTSTTMFKIIFSWCITWCFVGFSSCLLKIFTRIVTYFLRPRANANVKRSTENGSSFQLDYRLTSSTYPHAVSIRQVIKCCLSWSEWSIDSSQDLSLYFFAMLTLFSLHSRNSMAKDVRTSSWSVAFYMRGNSTPSCAREFYEKV